MRKRATGSRGASGAFSGGARPAVEAAICAWSSELCSEPGQALARALVSAAEPERPARARALLFACARLFAFCESLGLSPSERLLGEPQIERFVRQGCAGLSPATRRTLRTNLRALARSLERHPKPQPEPLPRERAKAPYSEAELEGYLRLGACQGTEARRLRCQALICLGAGAGIVASELRAVRGSDVIERAGGVIVAVRGRRARQVPVLQRYQELLVCAARFAGEGLIVGGRTPARRNLTDELCRALSGDPSLPRLEAGRLRSTWLIHCARQIGLQAFMQAAGISCSQRLGDLLAALPAASENELMALLGGVG
jgi:integrase